jgi:hypothetical protein
MNRNSRQRPTRQEFEAAAVRFQEGNYPGWWATSQLAHSLASIANIFTLTEVADVKPSFKKDFSVIAQEQQAEGFVVGEEQLATFARNQLARYIESDRKH